MVKSPASVIGSALVRRCVRPEDHTKCDNLLLDAFGIFYAMCKLQVSSPAFSDSRTVNQQMWETEASHLGLLIRSVALAKNS